MIKEYELQVLPEVAANPADLKQTIARKFGLPFNDISHVEIVRKSVDARKKPVKINLKVLVFVKEDFVEQAIEKPDIPDVSKMEEVLIIGAGPAGTFCGFEMHRAGQEAGYYRKRQRCAFPQARP
jgi:uncharacterized FAD-dependent dehydrogenase